MKDVKFQAKSMEMDDTVLSLPTTDDITAPAFFSIAS